MSSMRSRSRKDTSRQRQPRANWLTKNLEQDIVRAAKSLGLSPKEYVRTMLALSNLIRSGLEKGASGDLSSLVKMANNPLFSALMQWMASQSKTSDTNSSSVAANPEPPVSTSPSTSSSQNLPNFEVRPQPSIPAAEPRIPAQYPSPFPEYWLG